MVKCVYKDGKKEKMFKLLRFAAKFMHDTTTRRAQVAAAPTSLPHYPARALTVPLPHEANPAPAANENHPLNIEDCRKTVSRFDIVHDIEYQKRWNRGGAAMCCQQNMAPFEINAL